MYVVLAYRSIYVVMEIRVFRWILDYTRCFLGCLSIKVLTLFHKSMLCILSYYHHIVVCNFLFFEIRIAGKGLYLFIILIGCLVKSELFVSTS